MIFVVFLWEKPFAGAFGKSVACNPCCSQLNWIQNCQHQELVLNLWMWKNCLGSTGV